MEKTSMYREFPDAASRKAYRASLGFGESYTKRETGEFAKVFVHEVVHGGFRNEETGSRVFTFDIRTTTELANV